VQDGDSSPLSACLSEEVSRTLQKMKTHVSITSRVRNKPSTAEIMAHALAGRNTHGDVVKWGTQTKLRNQVQLSTYSDCIGKNLGDLTAFADR
jgi:hypothetical protein